LSTSLKSAEQRLFEPVDIVGLHLQSRFVMSAMTRSFSPGGIPHEGVANYYSARAAHGVGLIITEATYVDRWSAADDDNVPDVCGDGACAGWQKVVDQVHRHGAAIALQLFHVGSTRIPGAPPHPDAPSVGPSGLTHAGERVSPPMSREDIADVVAAFARGALRAQELGFDAIEIHGGHGYLIDQFFWSHTNHRDDEYGGSIANRTRFAAEIVRACRQTVGPDFPILLRFSQWKIDAPRRIPNYDAKLFTDPDEMAIFLRPLVDAGVDLFDCSQRRYWEPEFEGSPLNLAGWTKRLTGMPVATVGSVGLDVDLHDGFAGQDINRAGIDRLIERFARDEFDLVVVGRSLLADAEWVTKMRDRRLDDISTFHVGHLASLI
jgi:2,4-dienoyl-CoA reductase-like NADH-dependent reductase (Old Yellow Enzyme family)